MSQTQTQTKDEIKKYIRICRELQIALMRLTLALDCALDVQESEDVSLKIVNLRLMRKTLEDARDNIENVISDVEVELTELFK